MLGFAGMTAWHRLFGYRPSPLAGIQADPQGQIAPVERFEARKVPEGRMRGSVHIRETRENPSSVSAFGRSTFSLKGRRRPGACRSLR
jgi:hypothetical protein